MGRPRPAFRGPRVPFGINDLQTQQGLVTA